MSALPPKLVAVAEKLLAASAESKTISLDAMGDAIDLVPVSTEDVDALMTALEAAGRRIVGPEGARGVGNLRRVLPAARALTAKLGTVAHAGRDCGGDGHRRGRRAARAGARTRDGALSALAPRARAPYVDAQTMTLRSSLEEQTGLSARELGARAAAELDPLPPVLPPEGVTACRVREAAARVPNGAGVLHVAGVQGCAGSMLVAAVAAAKGRPVVLVTSDLDAARRAADDAAFFVRNAPDEATAEDTAQGDVLVLAANESSPYADVNPDRRAAMSRLATLFHLASGHPWKVLAVPAAGLARKIVPRKVVRAHSHRVDRGRRARSRRARRRRSPSRGTCGCPWWRTRARSPCAARCSTCGRRASTSRSASRCTASWCCRSQPFDPYEQRTKKAH